MRAAAACPAATRSTRVPDDCVQSAVLPKTVVLPVESASWRSMASAGLFQRKCVCVQESSWEMCPLLGAEGGRGGVAGGDCRLEIRFYRLRGRAGLFKVMHSSFCLLYIFGRDDSQIGSASPRAGRAFSSGWTTFNTARLLGPDGVPGSEMANAASSAVRVPVRPDMVSAEARGLSRPTLSRKEICASIFVGCISTKTW